MALGMVRIRGGLCRARSGRFTRCKKPTHRGTGKGYGKKHTRGVKGRCLKWSKGRTRCIQREHSNAGYKKRRRRRA